MHRRARPNALINPTHPSRNATALPIRVSSTPSAPWSRRILFYLCIIVFYFWSIVLYFWIIVFYFWIIVLYL